MSEELAMPLRSAAGSTRLAARRGRYFFLAAAVLLFSAAVFSFSPTFYLRGVVRAPVEAGPIPPYIIVHGLVMTAWYLIFVVQAGLAGSGNVALHRRVGMAGAVIAAAVLVSGVQATLSMPGRLTALGLPEAMLAQFGINHIVVGNLVMLTAFAGLSAAAIMLRRQRPWHGRLLFCAFCLSFGPAFGGGGRRLLGPLLQPLMPWGFPAQLAFFLLAAVALIALDLATIRRLHPGTLVGCAVMALTVVAAIALAETPMALALLLRLA